MKKIIAFVITLPIILVIMSFTSKTTVQFMAADWDTAKNKAFAEGKLYFVDFDASYCATCRNMDQSTYMSDQLAGYIQKNVVALRVDVQDFDGVMWSQQYEVEALPTMLIFDEKGKLVKRIVGYKSAADLMQEFESIKTNQTVAPKPTPAPVAADKPMLKPDAIVKTNSSPTTNPTITSPSGGSFMNDNALATPKPRGKGLYEVDFKRQASEGFGVQVGVYSGYETVMEQAALFKRKYTKKTLVHIDTHNGSTVYKLLIGTFKSKRDAYNFRNDLRKDGADGLIKDLSYLG